MGGPDHTITQYDCRCSHRSATVAQRGTSKAYIRPVDPPPPLPPPPFHCGRMYRWGVGFSDLLNGDLCSCRQGYGHMACGKQQQHK